MERLAANIYLWPLANLLIGTAASVAGGALGGIAVGGKDLGNTLAATMGVFFGPLAGASGVVAGLFVLALLS